MPDESVHAVWSTYWLIWFVVTFPIGFLIPETVALVTDWKRTLSATVWDMEDFIAGQSVAHWTAGHFLFIGILGTLFIWLFFHFGMGWWRG